jgi:hypothetical protein
MLKASRAHLAECGEGYFAHMRAALAITLSLGGAALACAVHAFVPALFTRTASTRVEQVSESIRARRAAASAAGGDASAEVGGAAATY